MDRSKVGKSTIILGDFIRLLSVTNSAGKQTKKPNTDTDDLSELACTEHWHQEGQNSQSFQVHIEDSQKDCTLGHGIRPKNFQRMFFGHSAIKLEIVDKNNNQTITVHLEIRKYTSQ